MATSETIQPTEIMQDSSEGQTAIVRVRNILDRNQKAIQQAIPPTMKHLTAQRLISIAMTTLASNPHLQKCEPYSIAIAVKESAALGLQLDGVLGHAYLVPYNTKTPSGWVSKAKLQAGYKGLTTMALRNRSTEYVSSEVVYDCDQFQYSLGTREFLKHRPADVRPLEAKRTHTWAYMRFKSGQVKFIVMTAQQIEKIKAVVLNRMKEKDTPWKGEREIEDEMWKKTALRRLLKTAPMEESYAMAISRDEMREAGVESEEERLQELSEVRELIINSEPEKPKGGLYDLMDMSLANRIYNASRKYDKKMSDEKVEAMVAYQHSEEGGNLSYEDIAKEAERLAAEKKEKEKENA